MNNLVPYAWFSGGTLQVLRLPLLYKCRRIFTMLMLSEETEDRKHITHDKW